MAYSKLTNLSKTDTINKKNLIYPNFINNRFDLTTKKDNILEYIFDKKTYYITYIHKNKTLIIGVQLMSLTQKEFDTLISKIFEIFKDVNRIKIECSLNKYDANSIFESATYYITDLPENEIDLLSNVSSKTRYGIKNKIKKINNAFSNVKIEKFENKIPVELFTEFFKFKRITHKKKYFIMTPKKYQQLCQVTHAYSLKIDNKIVAIVHTSELSDIVYLENVTYDMNYSKYGVGIALLYEMIKDCTQRKKKCIFWGLHDSYKKHFANREYLTFTGIVYRSSKDYNYYRFLKNFSHFRLKNFIKICKQR